MREGGKEGKKKQREEQTDSLSGILGRTKIWLKGKENCFFADDCAFKTSGDLSVSVDTRFPVSWSLLVMLSRCCHSSSRNNFTQASFTYLFLTNVYVCFSAMDLRSALGSLLFVLGLCEICTGFVQGELNHTVFSISLKQTCIHTYSALLYELVESITLHMFFLPNLTQTSASSPHRSIVLPSFGGWWDGSNLYNCSVRCELFRRLTGCYWDWTMKLLWLSFIKLNIQQSVKKASGINQSGWV